MNEDFGVAMRRALSAVRSGEVSEATSILQQALAVPGLRMRQPLREAVRSLRDSRLGFRPPDPRPVPAGGPELVPEPTPEPAAGAVDDLRDPLPAPVPEPEPESASESEPEPASAEAEPESAPRIDEGAAFLEAVHVEAAGSRRYRLYRPASLMGEPPDGLVLMLHGCTQTPEDFATGTRMNDLAEAHRLVVVYPEQPRSQNGRGCWNWFRPGDQARGAGEPAILAGLAVRVATDFAVPEGRIFVAGLSAGGGMAAVLGAAYPDIFSAVGVHSGPPHGSANDVLSALAVMRGDRGPGAGPTDLVVPLIVFHGDADTTVHPSNAERLAGSEPGDATRAEAGGRGFTRRRLQGQGGAPVELWLVEGAGHAWSGGDSAGSFADASGPDASAEMVRFFLDPAA